MKNGSVLKITIGLLVLVVISEVIVYHPYFKYSPNFEIETYKINSLNLTINYKISTGAYPSRITIDFLIAQKIPNSSRTIYIYYDPKYQMALVDKKAVNGIINHLIAELMIRGYPSDKIKIVNVTELQHIVSDIKSAKKSIIIIPTGAFPDTVYSREKNLIKPWIEHGGVLIWTTGQFGYYSAKNIFKFKQLNPEDPWHPKDEGQKYFFGHIIIVKNKRFKEGKIPTQYAKALKLSYNYVYRGVSLSAIQALNGIALGYIDPDSGAVSIASIPLGYGKVIIFGGDIISGPQSLKFVRTLSHDIAQIIVSGILYSNLIMYKEYYIKNWKTLKDSVKVSKDMIKFNSGILIMYIFESDNEGTYFKKIIFHFNFKNGGDMIEKSDSYNNRLT